MVLGAESDHEEREKAFWGEGNLDCEASCDCAPVKAHRTAHPEGEFHANHIFVHMAMGERQV